ncbi:hypothetical protein [Crateriforma spongiae]|uniref:hypothetical protein n=1 Tax=Crateriforma spongiae TaxID=2724528 RepID=UPI001447FE1B|nr:hypothetical protein [Crateriforma spongiae]
MAKKKTKTPPRRDTSGRIDLSDFGIDLSAILEEIRPHLNGTYAEIGKRAGNMPAGSVSNTVNGHVKPSLGAVAAIAHATGGRLVVRYEPPKKRKSGGS